MTTIIIPATGHSPVTFEGEQLAHAREMLEGDRRGVELALYRRADGVMVVVLTHVTSWGDERPVVKVNDADTLDEAAA